MANLTVADTIFDNPTFNDLNPTGLIPTGGRLMSSAPHVDGLMIFGAPLLEKDSANLVITRNATGDWSLNRTAAGAETYDVRLSGLEPMRTGEKYIFDLFGQDNKVSAPSKGLKITDFFVISKAGVVALTSATLRLGKTVYSTTAAPPGAAAVQTDLVAATAVITATSANYVYQSVAVPAGSQVFHIDDLGLIEVEYRFVMANTGTVQVAALGVHCNFNFN